ncbi:hypothetical protein PIB30_042811 [Stylosanthes scabra]|uniref:Ubiquinol oxidase n=1 Tax=Stylosanthes scabra TaxID=79078 RepID=A0ABU6TEW7_9FABA|nr:hypothetical protein [Stylosanthes scabra]
MAMMMMMKGGSGVGIIRVTNEFCYLLRGPLIHGSIGVRNTMTTLTMPENKKKVDDEENNTKGIVSYWGIQPSKVTKDDGSQWNWTFFRKRYGCRAMMLETAAAVPGMVAGMLLHCKSLRRFEHSGGWIKALLEEAENERMHLMTFMEVSDPKWYERALVIAVQGVFFNAYLLGYMVSPKFAHRMVGYLEEEAIHSYTEFLKEVV